MKIFDSDGSAGRAVLPLQCDSRVTGKSEAPLRGFLSISTLALSPLFPDFLARSCPYNLQCTLGQILLHLQDAARKIPFIPIEREPAYRKAISSADETPRDRVSLKITKEDG